MGAGSQSAQPANTSVAAKSPFCECEDRAPLSSRGARVGRRCAAAALDFGDVIAKLVGKVTPKMVSAEFVAKLEILLRFA